MTVLSSLPWLHSRSCQKRMDPLFNSMYFTRKIKQTGTKSRLDSRVHWYNMVELAETWLPE